MQINRNVDVKTNIDEEPDCYTPERNETIE